MQTRGNLVFFSAGDCQPRSDTHGSSNSLFILLHILRQYIRLHLYQYIFHYLENISATKLRRSDIMTLLERTDITISISRKFRVEGNLASYMANGHVWFHHTIHDLRRCGCILDQGGLAISKELIGVYLIRVFNDGVRRIMYMDKYHVTYT